MNTITKILSATFVISTCAACGDEEKPASPSAIVAEAVQDAAPGGDADRIHDDQLEGRLQWLLKCGYIDEVRLQMGLEDHTHPIFQFAGSNDVDEPCRDLGKRLGGLPTLEFDTYEEK